jgi:hypothetical protein
MPTDSARWISEVRRSGDDEGTVSVTLGAAEARLVGNGSLDEVVLTPEGYAKLEEEYSV